MGLGHLLVKVKNLQPAKVLGRKPYSKFCSEDGQFCYYDWWNCSAEDIWFTNFIRYYFPNNKDRFNFYGVFGNNKFVRRPVNGHKIFFSGENLNEKTKNPAYKRFNHCLDYVDLSMGFENISHPKYLRFPLWILYLFPPNSSENDIRRIITEININRYEKTEDCAVIASHDRHGTRQLIYNDVKKLLDVTFAGKWNNNTRALWDTYGNDKREYLKIFKFNICAENMNSEFYATEKIFEAFISDCIPLYYGADNNPEPGVINKDAVLFWKADADNVDNKKLLLDLKTNKKIYDDFMKQPKLLPSSVDFVIDKMRELRGRIAEILDEK